MDQQSSYYVLPPGLIEPNAVPFGVCFQLTKDVVGQLDSVKIDLRGIILLEAEGKQNLLDFSEAGLSEINYADYLDEVTKAQKGHGTNVHEW